MAPPCRGWWVVVVVLDDSPEGKAGIGGCQTEVEGLIARLLDGGPGCARLEKLTVRCAEPARFHARLHALERTPGCPRLTCVRVYVKTTDVDEAVRLMKVATQSAATDPTTGMIDMDLITTGRSAAARTLAAQLARAQPIRSRSRQVALNVDGLARLCARSPRRRRR